MIAFNNANALASILALIKGGEISKQEGLFLFARTSTKDLFKTFLVETGFAFDTRDSTYGTLLHVASFSNLSYLLRTFDCSSLIEERDQSGRTPFMNAVLSDKSRSKAELLLAHGANLNVRDNKGLHTFTLLLRETGTFHNETQKFLSMWGAKNLSQVLSRREWMECLELAIVKKQLRTLTPLLDGKSLTEDDYMSTLAVAVKWNESSIKYLDTKNKLLLSDANLHSLLFHAIDQYSLKAIDVLLNYARRNLISPPPKMATWSALNDNLEGFDTSEKERIIRKTGQIDKELGMTRCAKKLKIK